MAKSIEQLKFEASERELESEIKQNPLSCGYCSIWQSGGDMSSALYMCDYCGAKEAKSDIKRLIIRFSQIKGMTYEQAWDIARGFLGKKRKDSPHGIYFDEDYFYTDLSKYFGL